MVRLMKTFLYDWFGLNAWLFKAINAWHAPWLDQFMLLGSRLAEHDYFAIWLSVLVLAAVWVNRQQPREALLPWFSVIAVFSLAYVVDGWVVSGLKEWFSFPRPSLALPPEFVHVVGSPEHNLMHSLPSGHTSFAMLIVASAWPVLTRPWRWAAGGFVLWVALSRISLGAHFPADVTVGALSCLLVVWLVRKAVAMLLVKPA
jgi:membrane-associated phospholipid phosphatase